MSSVTKLLLATLCGSVLGGAPPKTPNFQLLGPAVNYTLNWVVEHEVLTLCVSCDGNAVESWIGIGFTGTTKLPGMQDYDLVTAYQPTAGAAPVVQTWYSNTTGGFPNGNSTLKVIDGSAMFHYEAGNLNFCFERLLNDGHHIIEDGAHVIWAHGPTSPTADLSVQYHGSDGHDPSGKTQSHRSDETPPIMWIKGTKQTAEM
eukprot:m.150020 g.150020  ORF g.150020 m.150020 type:complete len:202 (-) comp30702_c0_seq1:131-736(-)